MSSSERTSTDTRYSPAPSFANSAKSTETSTSLPAVTVNKAPDDSSKLKAFLSILRKFIGVADIAAVRFSLPAQLLEPTPNLEYWNYLDRPETFISIPDSDDELGRMLAVLRFWFTKDLKYVKGKPCKPYNSTLGEFFRCQWNVKDTERPVIGTSRGKALVESQNTEANTIKLSYLTEQTSHHPPVSAFWVDCPQKGITARGFDQLSAKFTGTSVRVLPGSHNLGIFINLESRDNEEYQLTHPCAHLGGILRGSLNITVADICFITCPKSRLKTILQYMEDGWLGKSQNKVIGVVYRYDPENDHINKLKDVPEKDIVARIDGCWRDKIYFSLAGSSESTLLMDLGPLLPEAKLIPPEADQLPNESRRFWTEVTEAILSKQYGQATKLKQAIEERQREKAALRESQNEEWQPRFFTGAVTPVGRPDLTEDGKKALKGLYEGDYHLSENIVTGA